MKVVSIDLSHKSDLRGVALDVDPARAGDVYRDLVERVEPRVDGVLVERMADAGHEVIVGVLHDETFGPLVMIGAGGIYAELLDDVRFVPLPVDHTRRRRARSTTSASPPCSRVPAAGAAPTSTRSPTSSSGWRRSRRTATSPSSTSTPSPCTTRGEASPSSMRGWCCAGADERARGAGLACPYKA